MKNLDTKKNDINISYHDKTMMENKIMKGHISDVNTNNNINVDYSVDMSLNNNENNINKKFMNDMSSNISMIHTLYGNKDLHHENTKIEEHKQCNDRSISSFHIILIIIRCIFRACRFITKIYFIFSNTIIFLTF